MSVTTSVAHTPGPWIAEPIPEEAHTDPDLLVPADYVYWIVEECHAGQVLVAVEDVPSIPGQALANARLIAAAPQLLAELKAFEQLITSDSDDLGFHLRVVPIGIDRVRALLAAIAKAEGRS